MKSRLMCALILLSLLPCWAVACDGLEVYASLHHWNTINSEGNGKTLRLKGDVMRGLGVGLPLDDHFTLNGECLFGDPSTTLSPGSNTTADMMMFGVNLDYKIREENGPAGSLSPYVTAGLGTMNFNQDVVGGIDEWDMSYSLGAGIYWNMPGSVFLKFAYRWVWVDMDVTDSMELFDGVSLGVGMYF